jgi:hypothetical protein
MAGRPSAAGWLTTGGSCCPRGASGRFTRLKPAPSDGLAREGTKRPEESYLRSRGLRQRPDATGVAEYRTWQRLGRQVRRGERGIAILAPCSYNVRADDEPDTDDNARRVLRAFKIAHAFDIDQTDGEPIPDVRPALLDGDAPAGLWDALAAQVAVAGFELHRDDCHPANGRTDYTARR